MSAEPSAAKATDNDNTQLPTLAGEVSLSSGRYYFGGAQELLGATQINIEGHVELYVEGDIESVGALNIILGPAAELELWLSGTIASVGNIRRQRRWAAAAGFQALYGGRRGVAGECWRCDLRRRHLCA